MGKVHGPKLNENRAGQEEVSKIYLNLRSDFKFRGNRTRKMTIGVEELDVYTGFIAPPYIDEFWAKIYPTREYMAFCKEIFGGFLLRNHVDHPSTDLSQSYKETLKYLELTSDVVKYFKPLWPRMKKNEDLIADYKGFASLTVPELYSIFKEIDDYIKKKATEQGVGGAKNEGDSEESGEEIKDKEAEKQEIHLTLQNALDLSTKIILGLRKCHGELKKPERSKKIKTDVKFGSSKILLDDYLKNMNENISSIKKTFVQRLKGRFMLDEITAKRWIEEYFIYLGLLSNNNSIDSHAVPPHIILEVWKVHYEFFENYIETTGKIFGGKHIYPDDFCDPYLHSKASKERYSKTLEEYEILTGDKPEPRIWIPVDNLKTNR